MEKKNKKEFEEKTAQAVELLPAVMQYAANHIHVLNIIVDEFARCIEDKEKAEMLANFVTGIKKDPELSIPIINAAIDVFYGVKETAEVKDCPLDEDLKETLELFLTYAGKTFRAIMKSPELVKETVSFIVKTKQLERKIVNMEFEESSESDQESFVDHLDEEKESSEQEEVSFVDPLPEETEDSPTVVGDGIEESVPKAKRGRPKKSAEKKVFARDFKRAFAGRGLH